MKRPRVLLADDHAILTEGLRGILEPEIEVVGSVEDGQALVAAAEQLQPDLVIADITMPLLNGIEAIRQIKKSLPKTRFLVLTMHPDVMYATEALAAGASGYVLKHSISTELLTAVRAVLGGRTYIAPRIKPEVQEILIEGNYRRRTSVAKLTGRQRQVLQLIAEGHSLGKIAEILHVSPRTVEFHKYNISRELGLHSTAELTQFAIRHGLASA